MVGKFQPPGYVHEPVFMLVLHISRSAAARAFAVLAQAIWWIWSSVKIRLETG